jgi:hypothetical protein
MIIIPAEENITDVTPRVANYLQSSLTTLKIPS